MDKKEKIIMKRFLTLLTLVIVTFSLNAQDVSQIQFCDRKYENGIGKDDITLFLKVLDSDNNRSVDVSAFGLEKYLVIYEDGNIITSERRQIKALNSGLRIPSDYTFSLLIDLSIPEEGKKQIFEAVGDLVKSAPDSCVYLSFFGDEVSSSTLITKQNYNEFKARLMEEAGSKYFYDALYLKLAEFGKGSDGVENTARAQTDYTRNDDIRKRAKANKDKNFLFIFTEGSKRPDEDPEGIGSTDVEEYQTDMSHIAPKVYAFYYTGNGFDESVKLTLDFISTPRDKNGTILKDRQGAYKPSDDLTGVLEDFKQAVQDAMYDFAFTYKATEGKSYTGRTTYYAEWKDEKMGEAVYSIGTIENPWPTYEESIGDIILKIFIAIVIAILSIAFFFCVMKILVPSVKSKMFAMKYYKRYEPEANVQRRICHYCRQEILPGQEVVTKCKHVMHVFCWQQNGYKCAEYGQNCKSGIQDHTDWRELFTINSLRDCYQTITGICAGLVSWIIYELLGRGGFDALSRGIVKTFLMNKEQQQNLLETSVTKVSAFLMIGLLLAFVLSLIFRYQDEYRKKDWGVYLNILGLSALSGIIGMAAFAIGAIIFCLLLSAVNTSYIPWYCSLPAYLLFSVCTSLSLTIKSTVPVKSAMVGGLCSAFIGFLVLYFSSFTSSRYSWMNMLLDFVIYGGGLGASLVTVRMLAEKYYLLIRNGVKAGQKIPIHKWMNATGGGNKVSLGMTGECEIQMNWEKSNKVAKEHAQLYIDHARLLPMIKPLATGVIFNTRVELPVGKPSVLSNGDTFKIGDTMFQYVESN